MIAIRQIIKPENNRITIDLPTDFVSDEVEVIIIPFKDNASKLKPARKFGLGKDSTSINESFYEPLEDFKEYI